MGAWEMTDSQWYGNKDLFEMIHKLEAQMMQLCIEVKTLNASMTEFQAMCARLEACEKQLSSIAGAKQGGKDMWGYIVGAIGLLFAILSRLQI